MILIRAWSFLQSTMALPLNFSTRSHWSTALMIQAYSRLVLAVWWRIAFHYSKLHPSEEEDHLSSASPPRSQIYSQEQRAPSACTNQGINTSLPLSPATLRANASFRMTRHRSQKAAAFREWSRNTSDSSPKWACLSRRRPRSCANRGRLSRRHYLWRRSYRRWVAGRALFDGKR